MILCFTDPLVSYFISHVSYIIWYLRYSFLSCVLALTAANTPLSVFNLTQQMLIFHRCNSCSVFPRQPSSTWWLRDPGIFHRGTWETNGPRSYHKERVKLYGQVFPWFLYSEPSSICSNLTAREAVEMQSFCAVLEEEKETRLSKYVTQGTRAFPSFVPVPWLL